MSNFYDQIEIDIEKAHDMLDKGEIDSSHIDHYFSAFDRYLYKKGWLAKLVDNGFKRDWFEEFAEYWGRALNGRPLNFHDFFFLYTNYRTRFQAIEVKENSDAAQFLYSWQSYENIYIIFHSVYKYALHPFSFAAYEKYLKEKKNGKILEYGCGIAPISTSLIKNKFKGLNYTIADIRNFSFHYAKFRLKQHDVKCVDIIPYENPPIGENFDIIFLMTVLEHLPDPLNIIELLTKSLNRGGYLVFDYILGDGGGLDTVESVKQRKSVLEFIENNYQLKSGEIKYDNSMGPTVVQKSKKV